MGGGITYLVDRLPGELLSAQQPTRVAGFTVSPSSTSRRMASERVVSCAAAQASTLAIDSAGILAII